MNFTKNSWGLTVLATTSGLGAYLLWKTIYPTHNNNKSRRQSNNQNDKKAKNTDEGPFDFVLDGNKNDERALTDASERTSSTLGEEEIQQVWQERDVNLKLLRQLLQQKEAQRQNKGARPYSRLSLFSHLVGRLEETLDERHRIQAELGNMRIQQQQQLLLPPSQQEPLPSTPGPSSNTSVCMVVQRYRGATLLCNDCEIVRVGANTSMDHTASLLEPTAAEQQPNYCGLLVYVSFAKGCTQQAVQTAARIVVNLPLLSLGGWGDGVSQTMNVIDLAKHHPNAASITIVPQADLINKIKSQGKSIQYHSQIEKSEGNTLYHYFVNSVRGLVLEQQCQFRNDPLPSWYSRACSAQVGSSPERADPSIPPQDLFRHLSLYKSWDDNGIPLTDAEDEPTTKSAQKKLRKAQVAHRVRHLKHLREHHKGQDQDDPTVAKNTTYSSEQPPQQQEHVEHWATAIDPAFVHIVAGTFGKRQSLEFVSSMGPLCHVVQV